MDWFLYDWNFDHKQANQNLVKKKKKIHKTLTFLFNNSKDLLSNFLLNVSKQRSLSDRNQSFGLQSKLMDWFLYNKNSRHER